MVSDARETVTIPWWLEGGGERCPVCLTAYAYEVEVRCAACDRPSCPLCAVRVHTHAETVCFDCAEAEDAAATAPGG